MAGWYQFSQTVQYFSLEKVFRKLRWAMKRIKIDGECLSNLRFADDIIIFANSIEELQEMLYELN